jgi:hypothetical protein
MHTFLTKLLVRSLLPLLAAAPLCAQSTQTSTQLDELLQNVRGALGTGTGDLQCQGETTYMGLSGACRLLFDARGSFLFELDTELPFTVGFDGKTIWHRDTSGVARALELEEADRWKLVLWVLTGHWLHESRPVEVELLEAPQGDGPARLALSLRGTPMRMELELDAQSWLPAELTYDDRAGGTTWSFGDWRSGPGPALPYDIAFSEADATEHSMRLQSVAPAPQFFRSPYELVASRPGGISFDAEAEPVLETERVATGHLIVHPLVEGEDVGWFIFDTGAGGMCIDPKVADELGLAELGETVAVGVAGKTTTGFRKGTSFELGPARLEDPTYVALDLSFLSPIFGVDVAGVVGYDLFARCVVEIETGSGTLALHDPQGYELRGTSWEELILDSNIPCVRASFEGDRSGVFRLDTGANGTVSFHAPAVESFALLEGRELQNVMVGGVGGMAPAKTGPLEYFELAGHRFETPEVTFALAEIGAFADHYTIGNIGHDLLAPFRMVLDYSHKRIAFVPLQAEGR